MMKQRKIKNITQKEIFFLHGSFQSFWFDLAGKYPDRSGWIIGAERRILDERNSSEGCPNNRRRGTMEALKKSFGPGQAGIDDGIATRMVVTPLVVPSLRFASLTKTARLKSSLRWIFRRSRYHAC